MRGAPQTITTYTTMKRIIRYITRWAWAPVLKEFVLRQKRAEHVANRLADALGTIAYRPNCIPVQTARRAIRQFQEGKQ